ncbi:hypothetical protein SZ64_01950 [Erythrobacter sp. SG61-1L]|uniref:hypothetical protein n=1 Tax=Erythrobacter sp. SG61-1L TaxID=1603897 RepID=UPI0006C902E3|nr:hypothetical protein [Erythrobacter sp. SG61-1L]KPL66961.1 hypothetical protein SZ64_01950 [Erythrobacter sp. SG61-1L]
MGEEELRSRLVASFALAASFALPQMAGAKEPIVLEPDRPWTLDYAEERCSLIRHFGNEKKGLQLQIDSYGSRAKFRFLVTGNYVPSSNKPAGLISVKFTPDDGFRKNQDALLGKARKWNAVSFGAAFLPVEDAGLDDEGLSQKEIFQRAAEAESIRQEFEQATDSMTLHFERLQDVHLKMGKMTKPLAALRECIDNLYVSWGLDPAKLHTQSRAPIPDMKSVLQILSSYPVSMRYSGTSAFISVRIMVDEHGNATSCVVQNNNADKPFRDAVCNSLASRFEPALDADGNPIASFYQTNVIYRIN